MRLMPFLMAFAISACASTSRDVVTGEVKTVEAPIPVSVGCPKLDQIPEKPVVTVLPAGADIHNKAAAQGADLLAFEKYAQRADAIMRKCAAQP